MSREEDAYVIERMGKLLAEIAIIVNGTEPHDTLWSYHDLPEKVRALKQAQAVDREKVAMAMYEAAMIPRDLAWDDLSPASRNYWLQVADAAIDAVRGKE